MKTRDKILLTSLMLFNEEGEPNVSTVDISNEMDISPGNLYYHFKGKKFIIVELYKQFEQELVEILQAPINKEINMKDGWFYLYVVFEHLYKFRFFYNNLSDILQRHPDIRKSFKRLIKLKSNTSKTLLVFLIEQQILNIKQEEMPEVTENIIIILTHWINHASFRDIADKEVMIIHRGVFQIMSLIAPYFNDDYRYVYQQARHFYETLLAESSSEAKSFR